MARNENVPPKNQRRNSIFRKKHQVVPQNDKGKNFHLKVTRKQRQPQVANFTGGGARAALCEQGGRADGGEGPRANNARAAAPSIYDPS